MANDKYFSREDLKQLEVAEKAFTSSVKFQYILPQSKKINLLVEEIYGKYDEEHKKVTFSCPRCAYKFYRNVGAMYFASVEYWKKQDEEANTKQEETAEEIIKVEPKKKGRPKKQN